MFTRARVVVLCAASLFVASCASTQLNYNALDLANSVDDLITSQVVSNIGKFVLKPHSNPAQVSIPSGSVTTTNQASVSVANPINTAVTTTEQAATAAGAVLPAITRISTGVAAATTITPSLNNQASQNWSLSAISDSDQERRLRALYRFVTHPKTANLCSEYPLIVTQASMGPAYARSDDDAWAAATAVDTTSAYDDYLATYTDGYHSSAAQLRKQQLMNGQSPSDPEEKEWQDALTKDNSQSYANYLKKYPKGRYVDQALQQLKIAISVAAVSRPSGSSSSVSSLPTSSGNITVTAIDSQFLIEPSCVICSKTANYNNINVTDLNKRRYCSIPGNNIPEGYRDLYLNPRLRNDWLRVVYSTSEPVTPTNATYIGKYENLVLYTINEESFRQFILFVLEATNTGSSAGQSGKSGPSKQQQNMNAFPAFAIPELRR